MTILSFKSKKDKEMLYEKAKKMEKYASMIVDCLEEAGYNDEYEEDMRHEDYAHDNRYNYKRGMRY